MLNAWANRLFEKKVICCPFTKETLTHLTEDSAYLYSHQGEARYPIHAGVPFLVKDLKEIKSYSDSSEDMTKRYWGNEKSSFLKRLKTKIRDHLQLDFRIVDWPQFLGEELEDPQKLIVSIGGGPQRQHPQLINLNIDNFPNVDLVCDAHFLPLKDASIDGIYCEAVLEHLSNPQQALIEFYRVLKPGGKVFSGIPFLQAYHGYPHHYQNFTLTGHEHLYKNQGFKIINSGTLTGPCVALYDLVIHFILEFFPQGLQKPSLYLWMILAYPLRRWDKKLLKKKQAHQLACSTYVFATKK